MTVHKDKTICFESHILHMAFGRRSDTMGGEKYIRMDFKKYAAEDDDFIIKRNRRESENK